MRDRARRLLARFARVRENRATPVLVALSALFLALSLLVHAPALNDADIAVTRAVQHVSGGPADAVARAFTFLGNTRTLVVLAGAAALVFLALRRPSAAALCPLMLIGIPLNMLLKGLVGRPRPEQGVVEVLLPAVGLSFPSGHAMAATMFYGFLAYMAWVHVQRRAWRNLLSGLLVAVALGVSLSRVYLGAHWFSDVAGGWTAGLFCLLLLAQLYRAIAADELAPAAPARDLDTPASGG